MHVYVEGPHYLAVVQGVRWEDVHGLQHGGKRERMGVWNITFKWLYIKVGCVCT